MRCLLHKQRSYFGLYIKNTYITNIFISSSKKINTMITKEKFFENPFDTLDITPSRLFNFSTDVIGKFTAANEGNIYNTIIQQLTQTSDALGSEIGEVKSTLGVQKSSTFTVNEVMKNFKVYMSDNEGVIAKAIGGKRKAAFIEFYPSGLSEYANATKTKMPALLKQVFDAAEKYKTNLGAAQTKELKDFTTQYNEARGEQQTQKGSVTDNRTDRTTNRAALETELLKAIYSVGLMYAGDVAKCGSFFNFSLLYAPGRGKAKADTTPIVK
jgi:hypothetical protein